MSRTLDAERLACWGGVSGKKKSIQVLRHTDNPMELYIYFLWKFFFFHHHMIEIKFNRHHRRKLTESGQKLKLCRLCVQVHMQSCHYGHVSLRSITMSHARFCRSGPVVQQRWQFLSLCDWLCTTGYMPPTNSNQGTRSVASPSLQAERPSRRRRSRCSGSPHSLGYLYDDKNRSFLKLSVRYCLRTT